MNEPVQGTPIQRQEYLQKLAPFCQALRAAVERALGSDKSLEIFRSNLAGECIRCGIHVSGDELFALSQPPSAERASAKIGRLRLGDCARRGCDSCYYRLTFYACPQLDWAKLLLELEVPDRKQARGPAPRGWVRDAFKQIAGLGMTRQVGLGISLILLLLVLKQLYFGGRIPLLREPEHFRVDPAPEEAAGPKR